MRKSLQCLVDTFDDSEMHLLRFNVRIQSLLAPTIIKTIIKAQNSAFHFHRIPSVNMKKIMLHGFARTDSDHRREYAACLLSIESEAYLN